MRLPEGWKSYIWEAVKKAVKVPTFAAGGNRTPELCEKIIAEGKADFVALGRQLFADPEWVNKAEEGRDEDIRKCISCMECLGGATGRARDSRCSINVAVGRRREFGEIRPAAAKKKVMIVGAGPGGLEAARIAALRGHDVTLYDKKKEIGGCLLAAATPPGKAKLLWFRDYQAGQLKKLNVKVELGIEVGPELIRKEKPEAVIVATGAKPIIPTIAGIEDKKVVTALNVLEGKEDIRRQKVVIAGGGMVGAETAEFLAEKGNTVTIIEMLPVIAGDMDLLNRRGLMDALRDRNVTMLTEHEIVEVVEKGVIVVDKKSDKRSLIEADCVVTAMGMEPATGLMATLKGSAPEIYLVGDCREPRTIMAAIYEGAFTSQFLL